VRPLKQGPVPDFRMGYPLEIASAKLKLKNLYTGAEIVARKPAA